MNQVKDLFEEVKDYADLRLQIAELEIANKSSVLASSLMTMLTMTLLAFLFILILTIGISLWIGEMLGSWYLGFLFIAGIYLFAGLIMYAFRNRLIRKPFNNIIIRELFKVDD